MKCFHNLLDFFNNCYNIDEEIFKKYVFLKNKCNKTENDIIEMKKLLLK
jgi:hypothetical protein